jgi:hypothetical protein
LVRSAPLELVPAGMRGGPQHALFAHLRGRSAHSDTAIAFIAAAGTIPGVVLHRMHPDPFPCVVAGIDGRAFAFVEGMQGVTLWLEDQGLDASFERAALPQADLGPGWVLLPLFGSLGWEADLLAWLQRSAAAAANRFPGAPRGC